MLETYTQQVCAPQSSHCWPAHLRRGLRLLRGGLPLVQGLTQVLALLGPLNHVRQRGVLVLGWQRLPLPRRQAKQARRQGVLPGLLPRLQACQPSLLAQLRLLGRRLREQALLRRSLTIQALLLGGMGEVPLLLQRSLLLLWGLPKQPWLLLGCLGSALAHPLARLPRRGQVGRLREALPLQSLPLQSLPLQALPLQALLPLWGIHALLLGEGRKQALRRGRRLQALLLGAACHAARQQGPQVRDGAGRHALPWLLVACSVRHTLQRSAAVGDPCLQWATCLLLLLLLLQVQQRRQVLLPCQAEAQQGIGLRLGPREPRLLLALRLLQRVSQHLLLPRQVLQASLYELLLRLLRLRLLLRLLLLLLGHRGSWETPQVGECLCLGHCRAPASLSLAFQRQLRHRCEGALSNVGSCSCSNSTHAGSGSSLDRTWSAVAASSATWQQGQSQN